MSRNLSEFLGGFVLPLLGGGPVAVERPLRLEEVRALGHELLRGPPAELVLSRLRRARAVVAEPALEEPCVDELGLWAGLHNMLVFDHPERPRVWTRQVTWRRLEMATRTLVSLHQPGDFAEALARHLAVDAFLELVRRDVILLTLEGEERYLGQPVPRRRLRYGHRQELTAWIDDEHHPEVLRLFPDLLWATPVTCILRPTLAPPGWSPLIAAPLLAERDFARAVTHSWARSAEWIEVGGAVMRGLLGSLAPEVLVSPSLGGGGDSDGGGPEEPRALGPGAAQMALPGSTFNAGPLEIGALLGALIHLHFLKVLELGARLGVATATREPAVRHFLGLPLLLPDLAGFLGTPFGPATGGRGLDARVLRRWTEYTDHLAEVLPRDVVEKLRETLVPRILKEAP